MPLVRVVPLGGAGEIGKNCTVVEQDDDLIVVDVGLAFPHEEHYGVDIVIPDFQYLVDNKDRIKGVFLTHAHEDHVGALSFLLDALSVPVYCTPLTAALVHNKLEERRKSADHKIHIVSPGDTVTVGEMSVEFVRVTHSIPETCALAVRTSQGVVFFTADFKLDFSPVDGKTTDMGRLSEIGKEGVVLLLSDSTNIDRPGWGPSESQVTTGLRKVVGAAPGRVLVTMFASNIHRMQQVYDVAHELGRKVACTGRRMEQTIDTARQLGYLRIPEDTAIRLEEIGKYPADQLLILTTGSQGEPMAALSQMSRGEYNRLKVVKGDTVLYSARPIPGNEGVIWRTINRLFLFGAVVVTESETPIHVSGHAYREEIKAMVALLNPFYIAPVHGEPRHQHIYRELALAMGWPEHRVFTLGNGDVLSMDDKSAEIDGQVPWGEILIDQHGNAPVTDRVLSERSSLGHDGVVMVSLGIERKSGEIVSRPDIRSKGYSGPVEALDDAVDDVCHALGKLGPEERKSGEDVEALVQEVVRRTISKSCQQRPVVLVSLVLVS